jgi:hypothetical protein
VDRVKGADRISTCGVWGTGCFYYFVTLFIQLIKRYTSFGVEHILKHLLMVDVYYYSNDLFCTLNYYLIKLQHHQIGSKSTNQLPNKNIFCLSNTHLWELTMSYYMVTSFLISKWARAISHNVVLSASLK